MRLPIGLLLILTLLTGCHTSRQNVIPDPTVGIPADISMQTPQQRYAALCVSYSDWEDLSIPLKASLSGKNGLSCSGKATMKRGQWISISLRMLGFEVASLWVDTDSLHAIDRYHKMYISESISQVTANAGVTISDLQDLLLGRAFLAGETGGTTTVKMLPSFDLETAAEGLMIIPKIQPKGGEYGFLISPDVNSVVATSIGVADRYPVTVTYGGYVSTHFAGNFASVANISFPARKLSGSLRWEFDNARWNTGLISSWSAPRNYKRISGQQLIQTLSSF